MRQKASQNKLSHWLIDSAGTGAWHVGEKPDRRSIATAKAHGIDISGQRARQFTAHDFEQYDLILAMDRSNYNDILSLSAGELQRNRVKLILEAADPASATTEVPDPYWDDNGFEQVYQMLDEACEKIMQSMRHGHTLQPHWAE